MIQVHFLQRCTCFLYNERNKLRGHYMKFKANYSENTVLREKLYGLFEKVFGIEVSLLKDFHSRGFWNNTYQPFSYFLENKAIANVSLFELPLLINGKVVNAAGIQSVMTHPDFRGKGLMKVLFQKMLQEIDDNYTCSFLMTAEPELYTRFGFQVIEEHCFILDCPHIPVQNRLRKMDFFAEADLLFSLFKNREHLSQEFSPLQYESSFALNMYNPALQENLYYSSELNCVLVFEVKDSTLKLYDVIGAQLPSLLDLCAEISAPFEKIEFHFVPDAFDKQRVQEVKKEQTTVLMARHSFLSENQRIKLPITAAF